MNEFYEKYESKLDNELISAVIRKNSESLTNINTVSFSNSSDIQIGARVVYNGPVSIANYNDLYAESESDEKKMFNCYCFEMSTTNLKRLLISLVVFVVIVVALTGSLIAVYSDDILNQSNSDDNSEAEFTYYKREDWNARPHNDPDYSLLIHPIRRVIISHTDYRKCYTHATCTNVLKDIQDWHMNEVNDFGDIGYNFVITNDGSVYEGRGWDVRGTHTYGFNNNSIGISYNGNFNNELPTKLQIEAGFALFARGVKEGKLAADFKVYGNCQFRSGESPGKAFYEVIQMWPEWSEDIYYCCK